MPDYLGDKLNVSRETTDKLRAFEGLVKKWTTRINLVSPASVPNLWNRHIVDSAQVAAIAPHAGTWTDLGSGGGFPGIVVAIISAGAGHETTFDLVESDTRKSVFLKTVARQLELPVMVHAVRLQDVALQPADVVSARALSPLTDLLSHCDHLLRRDGVAIFPKGNKWRDEVEDARQQWSFDLDVVQSITDSNSAILKVSSIQRR